ncbi:uncharacterized protein [Hetaerina americana]|uniref:uncharacterized protein n=1 Tax=Hetaerina americana TaxID=62018 RepID=UPI003A7F3B60
MKKTGQVNMKDAERHGSAEDGNRGKNAGPWISEASTMKATFALIAMALAIFVCSGAGHPKPQRSMSPFIKNILKTVPEEEIIAEVRRIFDPELSSSFDDKLKQFLEGLKSKFATGLPQYGIPPLDPFYVDHFPFDIEQDFAKLTGNLDHANITQLSEYNIDYTKLNVFGLSVAVNISLPEIKAKGHYDINGEIVDLLPVYGHGDFNLTVDQFNASVVITAGTDDNGFIYVKELDLGFSLQGLNTHFDGLLDGGDESDLANKLISDNAPRLINAYSPQISGMLSDKIIEVANKALTNVTLSDLIHAIG